uniref:Uncharacterized protein LOC113786987 n=1 Tax=Cicer arietinum TaxID=3827 RepID=A0A3Q7XT37_CICAR|nr:uncharacterized protein LOC113786987 [Cicer arietinum]
MAKALPTLHKTDTGELIAIPPRKRAIGSRIEVAYSPKGYLISQSKYIVNILEHTHPTLYGILVDSLVYLTITRHDIAYVVHIVIQFVVSPTIVHWAFVLRILRYLRGTQFQGILFLSSTSLELRAYSDVDWSGDTTNRKSTT